MLGLRLALMHRPFLCPPYSRYVGVLRVLSAGSFAHFYSSSAELKYTLTVYQRSSQLEITLQAPMPTLMQLSIAGRPLFQGNHKPQVMEAFRIGQAAATFFPAVLEY